MPLLTVTQPILQIDITAPINNIYTQFTHATSLAHH